MPDVIYLTTLDVEALHAFIMEKMGSAPSSLRDRAILEAAVMRPQLAAYYADADVIEQAALLAVGISQSQAFTDGNKRTAFLAADVFLRLNGYTMLGEPLEMARQLEAVSHRTESLDDATARFAQWLRDHASRENTE